MTTCDTSIVAPPGSAVWYDLAGTTADVLAVLRLTDADVDAERIGAMIPAAARLIDSKLDRPTAMLGPPPAPELQQALIQVTIDLYQSKAPAVPGGFTVPPQLLDAVRSLILPHKQRWGVG